MVRGLVGDRPLRSDPPRLPDSIGVGEEKELTPVGGSRANAISRKRDSVMRVLAIPNQSSVAKLTRKRPEHLTSR